MNNIQKRFLAFLIGCIGIRSILTYVSYKLNNKYLPYITLFIGLGFVRNYVFNLRKTGPETFGKEIWWDMLRPIHAFFYLYFTYLAFKKKKDAFVPLLIDTIIGLFAFLYYHYSVDSFSELFN